MNKYIFLVLLLFSALTLAGLPPTSSKVSGDSSFKTTFQTDYGNMTATRSGIKITPTQTGTGAMVLGTAPTFTTSLTSPLVIGGTGATSTLILQTTSGVGTTNADMIFKVGNNGATEAMRILNTGSVGIGTASPNANALLDISSTTKAFMPPRMTTTQKNAVASPASGMLVQDTTLNSLSYYNGSAWVDLLATSGSPLTDDVFSFQVSSSGVVSGESADFINGNCTNANPSVCTFNSGVGITVAPNCDTTVTNTAANLALTAPASSSSTTITIQQNSSIVATQEPFAVVCQKSGADHTSALSHGVLASTLVGYAQVPGVTTGNVDIFSVSYGTTNASTVCSASPCSYLDQIGTAVSSITRSGSGAYTLNLARTYTKLKCVATGSRVTNIVSVYIAMSCASCSTIAMTSYTVDAAPVVAADTFGSVMCQGSY